MWRTQWKNEKGYLSQSETRRISHKFYYNTKVCSSRSSGDNVYIIISSGGIMCSLSEWFFFFRVENGVISGLYKVYNYNLEYQTFSIMIVLL